MTIKPVPRLVFTELMRSLGPGPGLASKVSIVILIFVLVTSAHPSRPFMFAVATGGVIVLVYLIVGFLIVLNARIQLTDTEVKYRDMFGRSRACSVDAIASLSLRRVKMMNLNQGVLMFFDSRQVCLLSGYGTYWPVNQVTELAGRAGAELEPDGAPVPLSAVQLSPTSAVPRSLRSPQTVQAVLGCGLIGVVILGVFLFDR